ncbi:MAG: hypothetical protein HYW85_04410 [Deltaproteobacteria bacterium]|nr:hypothetical protein [Deltaproteobacteria bacterium]MBI3016776.1 hypothetical protein [Deltaproteobacteria bacterium]
MRYFQYRSLPDTFDQDIYIWDVDKTYLQTNFESLRGLVQLFFEYSIDKRSLPGAKELLLELRRGKELPPLFFISASPVGLKKILEGKFLLDGIQHDGIILKDYRRLRKLLGKFRIKNNFSYKLLCLLTHRLKMPSLSTEILFGDDYERDADVYTLYADILNQAVDEKALKARLKSEKLTRREQKKLIEAALKVQKSTPVSNVVRKIFIHLVRNKEARAFDTYGDRLMATYNYMQTAALLFEMGKISKMGFRRVASSFELKYPKDGWTLKKSLQDLKDRSLISSQTFEELALWK